MKRTALVIQALLMVAFLCSSCGLFGPTEAPAAPTLSLAAGTYRSAQILTITQKDDLDIYYTLDGSRPSDSSTSYTAPIVLDENGAYTVKAITIDGSSKSGIASADYVVDISSVSGAIAFGGGVTEANVKVGLFAQDTETINICEQVAGRAVTGARIFINTSPAGTAPGEAEALVPIVLGTVSNTTDTYELILPDVTSVTTADLYLIAWYDADGDGALDLLRESAAQGVPVQYFDDGEYNRMAVKTVALDTGTLPSFVSYAKASETITGYQFKYYDITNDQNYKSIDLSPSAGSGFDFTIAATVDTN